MAPTNTRWRRDVLLLIVGALIATALISPVGAHVGGTVSHLWSKHIRPKADARYLKKNKASGVSSVTNPAALSISTVTPGTVLLSDTITVPGPGKVIAMVNGGLYLQGIDAADNVLVRLRLNEGTDPNTTEDGDLIYVRDSNMPAGDHFRQFGGNRVFTVSEAGDFTVGLTAWTQISPGETLELDETVLTLMFVPNGY